MFKIYFIHSCLKSLDFIRTVVQKNYVSDVHVPCTRIFIYVCVRVFVCVCYMVISLVRAIVSMVHRRSIFRKTNRVSILLLTREVSTHTYIYTYPPIYDII
jgi:hypothetical protein